MNFFRLRVSSRLRSLRFALCALRFALCALRFALCALRFLLPLPPLLTFSVAPLYLAGLLPFRRFAITSLIS